MTLPDILLRALHRLRYRLQKYLLPSHLIVFEVPGVVGTAWVRAPKGAWRLHCKLLRECVVDAQRWRLITAFLKLHTLPNPVSLWRGRYHERLAATTGEIRGRALVLWHHHAAYIAVMVNYDAADQHSLTSTSNG
jgi:hypothetical protein